MRLTGARHPRLPFLAALLFIGAASMGIAPSADGDIWWHLAAGREMFARGTLLFTDPFSVSAQGRPWVDVHWLFQLATFGIHRHFGLAGLVWVKCLVVGLGALLLLAGLERKPHSWVRPLCVTWLLSALFVARALLLVRPVIVSLFFLALFFTELERFRRDGRARHLWVLPAAQLLWANFQGLSALGPAFVLAYVSASGLSAAFGRGRHWPLAAEIGNSRPAWREFRMQALTLVACLLAGLVTPFGLGGLLLPGKLLRRLLPGDGNVYTRAVAENVPPFVLERWTGEFWHLKWYLAGLAFAFAVGRRRLRLSHVLLTVGFAALALLSNRNVLLLYWIATPIAAQYLAPVVRAWVGNWRPGQKMVWALNGAALVSVLCCSGVAAARERPLAEPSPFRVPRASASVLSALPLGGDIFSADHQGGYLIWQLFPRFRPYLDSRLVLRSAAEFTEYLALADEPQHFAAFQARYHFAYVVLPVAYPDRYLSLIATLYKSPDWKLIFSNGSEVLFARRDLATPPAYQLGESSVTTRILADVAREFAGDAKLMAAAQLHLASLDLAVGEFGQAERVLAQTGLPEADALTARCRLAAGDIAAAKQMGERLLRRNRDDVSSLNLMAQVALRSGELPQSVRFLRRALLVDPFDGEASLLLANLEALR